MFPQTPQRVGLKKCKASPMSSPLPRASPMKKAAESIEESVRNMSLTTAEGVVVEGLPIRVTQFSAGVPTENYVAIDMLCHSGTASKPLASPFLGEMSNYLLFFKGVIANMSFQDYIVRRFSMTGIPLK
jgi:hypothetical protein